MRKITTSLILAGALVLGGCKVPPELNGDYSQSYGGGYYDPAMTAGLWELSAAMMRGAQPTTPPMVTCTSPFLGGYTCTQVGGY